MELSDTKRLKDDVEDCNRGLLDEDEDDDDYRILRVVAGLVSSCRIHTVFGETEGASTLRGGEYHSHIALVPN